MHVARQMIEGVDAWLNNPRRPLEACGTSGQKCVLNGVLQVSVLDGWWAEAYDGANGFAIGGGEVHADPEVQDERDTDALFDVLENARWSRSTTTRDRDELPARLDRPHEAGDAHPRLAVQRRPHGDGLRRARLPAGGRRRVGAHAARCSGDVQPTRSTRFARFAWGVLGYNLAVVVLRRLRPRHRLRGRLRQPLAAVQRRGDPAPGADRDPDRVQPPAVERARRPAGRRPGGVGVARRSSPATRRAGRCASPPPPAWSSWSSRRWSAPPWCATTWWWTTPRRRAPGSSAPTSATPSCSSPRSPSPPGGPAAARRRAGGPGPAGWLLALGAAGLLVLGISGAVTALGDTLFPAGQPPRRAAPRLLARRPLPRPPADRPPGAGPRHRPRPGRRGGGGGPAPAGARGAALGAPVRPPLRAQIVLGFVNLATGGAGRPPARPPAARRPGVDRLGAVHRRGAWRRLAKGYPTPLTLAN